MVRLSWQGPTFTSLLACAVSLFHDEEFSFLLRFILSSLGFPSHFHGHVIRDLALEAFIPYRHSFLTFPFFCASPSLPPFLLHFLPTLFMAWWSVRSSS